MATVADLELADELAECYADPLRFVLMAYPWSEKGGPLEQYDGPDTWQREFLTELGNEIRKREFNGKDAVAPIRFTTSSGHGIGKSVLVAFLVNFLMSTRPNCKGTVTANTFTQLSTRTWATIRTWTKRCITAHWFEVTGSKIYRKGYPESWCCSAQSCKEENSEAFAGQHAADSTSFYINDEDSAIAEVIHQVEEGGLTDGEPMIFLFGNPTRSKGAFYSRTFGEGRKRWIVRTIDSRNCRFSNKALIQEWVDDRGEDSDFVRVRVRGIPPRADDSQFIDVDRITAAQNRTVVVLPDEPLIAGVDLAWGGEDSNVVRFRRGNDARSIPPVRVRGELTRDPAVMTVKLAEILTTPQNGHMVNTMFLDSAGVSGAIGTRLRALGHANVIEVNFGADSPDAKYAYMRDYMWGKMKDWLLVGAIDKPGLDAAGHGNRLEVDLSGPGYKLDTRVRIKLESKDDMKKRGVDSPDDGDALALTFAQPVAPKAATAAPPPPPPRASMWS